MLQPKFRLTFLFFILVLTGFAQDYVFNSYLPIVFINTNGQEILDEPKITAELGIVWNESGDTNHTSDTLNHFNGKIGIEIRGSSSQSFPKKSFGIELRDDAGEGIDFPLLGLPEEEDWILYAPYSDKTLIRNVLTFTLAAKLNSYTPRCRFVELIVNNKYLGVYVLMEKIKRDKNRVDIAKLKEDEISGEDLTGGYIVKIDKTTGSGGDGWSSGYNNSSGGKTYYQYEYPKHDDIVPAQKEYIKNYFDAFETAVHNEDFENSGGYASYINKQSFIDYIIMNELSKNVDGYRLSTFLYKDKNEKLNAGPIWDFNLAFGNADYYKAWETSGLQMYDDSGDENSDLPENPFWWKGLLQDPSFKNELRCNWENLRENTLSYDSIIVKIDSLATLLEEPSIRNFNRWWIMGRYVWPNYFVGYSYSQEIFWMKKWILARLTWLDSALPGNCGELTSNETISFEKVIKVFPNPVANKLIVQINSTTNSNYTLQLYSASGQVVLKRSYSLSQGLNLLEVNTSNLPSGIFICDVYDNSLKVSTHKIIKY